MVQLSHLYGGGNNGTVSYTGWFAENNVTTDQSPSTGDSGQLFRFTDSTSADRTLTLPSVDGSNDGTLFWVSNNSNHTITVTPNDSSSVWESGGGYGIELVERSMVCLRYNHSNTNWEVLNKSGGLVQIEGLKLYLPCDFQGTYRPASTYGLLYDKSKRHRIGAYGGTDISADQKLGGGALHLDGSNDYVSSNRDSADWDIFGSTTGMYTIAGWAYCTDLSVSNGIIYQFQSSDYFWGLRTTAGTNALQLLLRVNGSWIFSSPGDSNVLSTSTWFHWAIIIKDNIAAVYVDGDQTSYGTFSSAANFTGNLFIGREGSGSDYLGGRMDDIFMAASNPYDADPNSGKTDTLNNWDRIFQGVM